MMAQFLSKGQVWELVLGQDLEKKTGGTPPTKNSQEYLPGMFDNFPRFSKKNDVKGC